MNDFFQFRSFSQEQIRYKPNHHRSDSAHSVDLFKLIIPTDTDSSFSSLICPICSLPMMKPTLLPCQHTFCFKCIQNHQQIRPGSLPIHSTNEYLTNDHRTKLITCQKCFRVHRINSLSDLVENQSMELLINTLLCETCHQLYPSNQLDTCFHCFGVHCVNCYDDHSNNHRTDKTLYRIISTDETVNISRQNSDNQIFKARSCNTENKSTNESTKVNIDLENNENENIDPSTMNHPKKKSNSLLRKIMNPSRHRQSTKSPSSSVKLSCRSKKILGAQIVETSKKEIVPSSTSPVTPVRKFLNLFDQYTHAEQHINQCKQRQSQLDLSVQKLIEVLTTKTNENIDRISYYWIYLKQLVLDQYQTKTDRFQIFDYLLKTCCSAFDARKQVELYIQKNDEINASLQILSTTLTIVHDQQTLVTINQLFDREEQTTIRTLRRQFESLISSYTDELTFIIERINVYESRFSTWKNSNTTDLDSITSEWTQIIEHDYPVLIEKLANDFITKIPQVEKILVQMLRNMKKRLLNTNNNQTPSRRTSDS